MKKNLILRLGVAVLMMSVITLSLVSGTFAKYTNEITGSDSATAAVFEFDLTQAGVGVPIADELTAAPVTFNIFDFVSADLFGDGVNGADKLIAPGTDGVFDITLTNHSEVAVNVAYEIEETAGNTIPVYYTLGVDTQRYSSVLAGEGYGVADVYMPLTGIENSLEAALGAATRLEASDGAPITKQLVLNWFWLYEYEDALDTVAFDATDVADTLIGTTGTAELELTIVTTVTQVDPVRD